jgi:hydrogenase expression/formation protein HypE
MAETPVLDFDGWTCPMPLRDSPTVVMGHGGGGAMSAELIEHVFLPAFGSSDAADSAVLPALAGRTAFSTDSFVVRPLFFPGGSIGELAVNGTVNDLAMSGAVPRYLSAGFILEEGTDIAVVGAVAQRIGAAARAAGVQVVTGDTKVVEAGHGDGLYINTAGIGVVPDGVSIEPARARPGDAVIVSGAIGVHGIAILSVRTGLEFGTEVRSDTRSLAGLVATMLAAGDVHVLRDPTRGGVAATLNEIARTAAIGVVLDETAIPVPPEVSDACSLLGLDPLQVANEGKLVAFVPPSSVEAVLAAMRADDAGPEAVVVGWCTQEHPGIVVARTGFGATRIVDLPLGEQLPRIC